MKAEAKMEVKGETRPIKVTS